MIEKQETYQQDHDWKAEEENKSLTSDSSWEKKELEKEIDIAKMIHKEVTGYDRKEMKSHIDEFPSAKSSREADVCSEPRPAGKSRFVIQLSENADLFQDKSQGKPSKASDPGANSDVALGPCQIKERTASKPRKKRRPQSLNLGVPAELIYRKGDSDSTGDENDGSDSDNSPEKASATGNHCDSSSVEMMKDDQGLAKDQPVRGYKDNRQEDISIGESREGSTPGTEQVKKKASQVGPDIDLGSVNGPGKIEHDSSLAGVKGEGVKVARGKGLIDNKELAEVKLRQVRTHERKISSSGAEDIEGFIGDRGQRTSFHRLSGSSYQAEITRIVPLKPERSKSVVCKDERDRSGQDEPARVLRREYRWSVGSPEGPSDLNWTDVSTFHPAFAADPEGVAKSEHPDDSYQSGRGPIESQSFGSKISGLPKMAPPAPPVKTQKVRESGLMLRNSRNVGREPSLDAAKKRHSVTLLGICYSVIGKTASHELQTDSHAIFLFFYVFSDLKHSSILPVRACVKSRRSDTSAPSCGKKPPKKPPKQSESLDIFPKGNPIYLPPHCPQHAPHCLANLYTSPLAVKFKIRQNQYLMFWLVGLSSPSGTREP